MTSSKHIPVMLKEVLDTLKPVAGETYVDATFGNGGYSEAILKSADCNVIAIDRDPFVLTRASELKNIYGSRFTFVSGTFSNIAQLINQPVNGVVFDIGVSSMQLDNPERGFSFAKDAPLDMRMSQSGLSAKDIVNSVAEQDLANIIYKYGDEKKSRQIAHAIHLYRQQKPIETTVELAQIIYTVLPKKFGQIDPATRTFQAIRIAVNDELQQLESGLKGALDIVLPEGRIVVVDFHSLEDKIVKSFFAENSEKKVHISRYKEVLPSSSENLKPLAFVSKAFSPTADEANVNPRARSAKLRYAIKRKELSHE